MTLAFDAAYQGQSGGEPRNIDDPYLRVEDISYAIDYLLTLSFVDETLIAALGICAGGGATMQAACLDRRIRAVAGISIFDVGGATREMGNKKLLEFLEKVSAQKTAEAHGAPSC